MYSPIRVVALLALLIAACDGASSQGQPPSADGRGELPRTQLEAASDESPAAQFYEANGWEPVWTGAAEGELASALDDRARYGLDRLRFLTREGADAADREIALTEAALGYASALATGAVSPGDLYEIYTIPVPAPNLVEGLASALERDSLGEWFDSLVPQDAAYDSLSQAYLRYREQAREGAGLQVEDGPLIREGDTDPRVPRIIELLRSADLLESASGADSSLEQSAERPADRYTASIKRAVERLQADRGIAEDGIVGPDTIQALNREPVDRARAAAVALERRRWLERRPPPSRIDVNTASTMLEYFRDGTSIDRRKVIAGQPGWKTPQLQSPIYRLVANPTWTVPRSIENTELSGVGPAGLRERNMVRRDGWIVQLPGPENALGRAKFDMDNSYAIYLHDTPAKSLFDRTLRQLSHGCVRVENALAFARMLARHQGIEQEWREAQASDEERFVRLPDRLPVRLLYHPTYVEPSGEVRFVQDVYGWNDAIGQRLGFGRSEAPRLVPDVEDLGP